MIAEHPARSIHGDFPALQREHNGRKVCYFDGPGGSQVPRAVVNAMADYLYNHNANRGWAFPSSAETDAVIEAGRAAVADWIGGKREEVAFGASMTALTFQLSRVLARTWAAGDNIVVTQQDHHANVDTWRHAAAERNVTVRVARVHGDGSLDHAHFASLLDCRTRLVALSAASNVTGALNDVAVLCALGRSRGALTFVDSVHYSGHFAAEVARWGCDFLACSAYKFYGPRVGILWTRRDVLDAIEGLTLAPAPSEGPSKFERGILNLEGIAGLTAAIDYIASLATFGTNRPERLRNAAAILHRRGMHLFEHMWGEVGLVSGVTRYGPAPGEERTPTLSFAIRGRSAGDVARHLAQEGVFVSHGNFYAQALVASLGHAEHGLVRAGCMAYNTTSDVDRLVESLRTMK